MTSAADLASLIEPVARELFGEPNARLSNANELRWRARGSFSVSLSKGTWYDNETAQGGGVLDLVERETGLQGVERWEWLAERGYVDAAQERQGAKPNGRGRSRGKIVATFPYHDEVGELLFEVVKYKPKDFRQRRPAGNGGWIWKLGDVRRVLYHLPRLIEAIGANQTVLIVEGERDVETAEALGLVATCNPGGAGKWKPEHGFNEHFRGADVILVPDNDEAGWRHVNSVGAQLRDLAARVRVLVLPGAKDLSSWVESGGAREQFDDLVAAAPEWVAPEGAREAPADAGAKARATQGEDDLIEALSRMRPGVEFARERRRVAKQFGIRSRDVDDEIKARRTDREVAEIAPLHPHWNVDPWPEVADGDALLRDIVMRIRKHVTCAESTALTSALWTMSAWVHDEVATHSPILNVNSADSESGKTTLLGLISFLAPRCIASVEISEAALYRSIALWRPSFCIDEFDTVLASDDTAGLRAVINSGHTRGQTVIRCVEPDFKPEAFNTFAPKAIGMIGRKLPPPTLSRCIFVEMKRRKSNDAAIVKFGHVDDAELANLRSRLLRWSIDNQAALRKADPAMPPGFDNRRGDNWKVMLAIADLAGGDWGDRARAAASRIEGATDTSSISARLLADIKRIFDEDPKVDSILSATLVSRLKEDEEAPWGAWSRGKGLTQNSLAALLGGGGGRGRKAGGGFGICTSTIQPPGFSKGNGYRRMQFEDAWERYLPPEIGGESPVEGE